VPVGCCGRRRRVAAVELTNGEGTVSELLAGNRPTRSRSGSKRQQGWVGKLSGVIGGDETVVCDFDFELGDFGVDLGQVDQRGFDGNDWEGTTVSKVVSW